MPIERAPDPDTGRKVVPLHTGKVQIGRCYTPRPVPLEGDAIPIQRALLERPAARKRAGVASWLAFCVLAVVAAVILAGRS